MGRKMQQNKQESEQQTHSTNESKWRIDMSYRSDRCKTPHMSIMFELAGTKYNIFLTCGKVLAGSLYTYVEPKNYKTLVNWSEYELART